MTFSHPASSTGVSPRNHHRHFCRFDWLRFLTVHWLLPWTGCFGRAPFPKFRFAVPYCHSSFSPARHRLHERRACKLEAPLPSLRRKDRKTSKDSTYLSFVVFLKRLFTRDYRVEVIRDGRKSSRDTRRKKCKSIQFTGSLAKRAATGVEFPFKNSTLFATVSSLECTFLLIFFCERQQTIKH